jgi:uncharacterized protein YhbP (UPF0306 family)
MMRSSGSPKASAAPVGADARRDAALALIRAQLTMVLATGTETPWAAPVYYVYAAPGFYFFSSPQARHIEQALHSGSAAATIFADSRQWEDIQGLQMSGTIEAVVRRMHQISAIGRFLVKFPFARPFLQADPAASGTQPYVGDRVRIYAFLPQAIYYVNNRIGFGQRTLVDLK